jgi:hypothetical protein
MTMEMSLVVQRLHACAAHSPSIVLFLQKALVTTKRLVFESLMHIVKNLIHPKPGANTLEKCLKNIEKQ